MLPWNINHPRFGLSESVLKHEPLRYKHWSSILVPDIEFKFTHLTLVLLGTSRRNFGPRALRLFIRCSCQVRRIHDPSDFVRVVLNVRLENRHLLIVVRLRLLCLRLSRRPLYNVSISCELSNLYAQLGNSSLLRLKRSELPSIPSLRALEM